MKFFQFHLFCLVSMAVENYTFQMCTMHQEVLVSNNTFLWVWKNKFNRNVIPRLGKTKHDTILWPNSFIVKSRKFIDLKQHLIRFLITSRKRNTVRETKKQRNIKEKHSNFKQLEWGGLLHRSIIILYENAQQRHVKEMRALSQSQQVNKFL